MSLQKEELIKQFNKPILAILKCSSLVKFGKNKRGNSIFPCQPIKYGLPPFRVASKNKDRKDKIVLIQYLDWNKNLPRGAIINIIGNYGDIDAKQKGLINYYDIKPNKPKIKEIIESNNIKYEEKLELEIFSIDPKGCQDVDDAMSCQVEQEKTIVGIHIADVTRYLTKELIEEKLKFQTSSLYPYNQSSINLWGDKITKLASLFPNEIRTSISLFFTIIENEIKDVELKFLKIKSNRALSYTEADTLVSIYQPLKDLVNITNLLNKNVLPDTKELVSFWMVKANKWIVILMKKLNLPVIYRKHEELNILLDSIPKELLELIKYRWMKGAEYTLKESEHYGLGIKGYTHFTSPIRRITDTCIHWILKTRNNIINEKRLLVINQMENRIKKYHIQQSIIEVLDIMKPEEELDGYILDYNENGRIEIYILKYKKFVKTYLFDETIKKNTELKITDNKLEIKNLLTYEKEYIKIGEKIKITIRERKSFLPKNQFVIKIKSKKINNWFKI